MSPLAVSGRVPELPHGIHGYHCHQSEAGAGKYPEQPISPSRHVIFPMFLRPNSHYSRFADGKR